jgi:hypothetical protein
MNRLTYRISTRRSIPRTATLFCSGVRLAKVLRRRPLELAIAVTTLSHVPRKEDNRLKYLLCFLCPPLACCVAGKPGQAMSQIVIAVLGVLILNFLAPFIVYPCLLIHAIHVVSSSDKGKPVDRASSTGLPGSPSTGSGKNSRTPQWLKVVGGLFVALLVIGAFRHGRSDSSASGPVISSGVSTTATPSFSNATPAISLLEAIATPEATPTPGTATGPLFLNNHESVVASTPTRTISAEVAPLTDEKALAEFNALQDRYGRPHAKSVRYDRRTDSYKWIGPKNGRKMSLPRADFEREMND